MQNIKSNLVNKSVQGQTFRTFDVPDESMNSFVDEPRQETFLKQREVNMSLEEEFKKERQQKFKAQRLSEGAKKRIEILIGMTRGTATCTILGQEYELRTLSTIEMREAIRESSKFDGTVEGRFEIMRQMLARSLCKVGGIELKDLIGSEDLDDKLYFIDLMDQLLINSIYDQYVKLVDDKMKQYSFKNAEGVNEVVEDIKK